MCLLVLAHRAHARYPFILASNRDEFLERPTEPAHFWADRPELLAGRDVRAGGTWLGITRTGNFAILTNHRDTRKSKVQGRSRGLLMLDVLAGKKIDDLEHFEGYNLIHGPLAALRYRNNVDGVDQILPAGIHMLSNAVLNTPWPKTVRARNRFMEVMRSDDPPIEDLFTLLRDETRAPDSELPDTGVGLEWERALSAIMIRTAQYGTRCSTVITIDNEGGVVFEERDHATGHVARFTFDLAGGTVEKK